MHSNIVGGSTAKRVMKCPGSVKLVQQMPPSPASEYAMKGTLLHNVIAEILSGKPLESFIGMTYAGITLTQDLADEKLLPIFNKKKSVSMFEMTKLVSKNLK